MVDGDGCDLRRLRHEPQVHREPPSSVRFGLQSPPMGDAAAARAEMEGQRTASSARVGRGDADDVSVLTFVAVDPEHAVAPAGRAVARGRSLQLAVETPADLATETCAFEHWSLSTAGGTRHPTDQADGTGACRSPEADS